MNVWLIGCGGIGCYLTHMLTHSPINPDWQYVLVDGDFFEERNLLRQMYAEPGKNKAEVLAEAFTSRGIKATAIPEYLTNDLAVPLKRGIVICAADSNDGRSAALALAKKIRGPLLICANETVSYGATWAPRFLHGLQAIKNWYPEWFEAEGPKEHLSCTDPQTDPQTATANLGAGLMGYMLLRMWQTTDIFSLTPPKGLFTKDVSNDIEMKLTRDRNISFCPMPVEFSGSMFNIQGKYLC